MKECTAFYFNTGRLKVWMLLSDLNGFSRWHPNYELCGLAELGSEAKVSYSLLGRGRTVHSSLVINKLAKPQTIGWRFGVRGLLTLDESYDITTASNGVHIQHAVEFGGLIGAILAPFMRRNLRRLMLHQDNALAALLRRQTRLPPQKQRRH